MTNMNQY